VRQHEKLCPKDRRTSSIKLTNEFAPLGDGEAQFGPVGQCTNGVHGPVGQGPVGQCPSGPQEYLVSHGRPQCQCGNLEQVKRMVALGSEQVAERQSERESKVPAGPVHRGSGSSCDNWVLGALLMGGGELNRGELNGGKLNRKKRRTQPERAQPGCTQPGRTQPERTQPENRTHPERT